MGRSGPGLPLGHLRGPLTLGQAGLCGVNTDNLGQTGLRRAALPGVGLWETAQQGAAVLSPGTGVVRLAGRSQGRAEAQRDEDAGMSPVPRGECPERTPEQAEGCELCPSGTTLFWQPWLGLPPAL